MGKGESARAARGRWWSSTLARRLKIGSTAAAMCIAWVVWLVAQPPQFYQTALNADDQDESIQSVDRFELSLSKFQNQAFSAAKWQIELDQLATNHWMHAKLLKMFPGILPEGMPAPRIQLGQKQIDIGIRAKTLIMTTVVSVRADVFVTEQPHQVAIQIQKSQLGRLPIPIGIFANWLDKRMTAQQYDHEWIEFEGLPTVLINLPQSIFEMEDREVALTAIHFSDQRVLIQGSSVVNARDRREGSKLDF